jgi:hypothetical protein
VHAGNAIERTDTQYFDRISNSERVGLTEAPDEETYRDIDNGAADTRKKALRASAQIW